MVYVSGDDSAARLSNMLDTLTLEQKQDLFWGVRHNLPVSDPIVFENTDLFQPSFIVPPQLVRGLPFHRCLLDEWAAADENKMLKMPKMQENDEMCSRCMEKKYGNGYRMLAKMGWSHGNPLSAKRGKLVYPVH